jgi:ATP-dependent RNA circularization protein (DNA/RNA ligase family)
MRDTGPGARFAIQGELIGPGIQGNIYKLSKPEFHVFDVYNIEAGDYLKPRERRALVERMGLKHAPVLHFSKALDSVEQIIAWADGRSMVGTGPLREGIVFKQVDGGMTFKSISNSYLCNQKD